MTNKMEISNEIKAKVFAQYWGQKRVLNYNTTFNEPCGIDYDLYRYHINTRDGKEHDFRNIVLILKPLSEISDEDAIDVHKMYFENNYVLDYSGDTGSIYFQPKKRAPNKQDALKIVAGINYETGDFQKVIMVYQFLQSKGYDLPNWYLGGKTLHECGLAIYSNELKN